jgi:hypothetical protein
LTPHPPSGPAGWPGPTLDQRGSDSTTPFNRAAQAIESGEWYYAIKALEHARHSSTTQPAPAERDYSVARLTEQATRDGKEAMALLAQHTSARTAGETGDVPVPVAAPEVLRLLQERGRLLVEAHHLNPADEDVNLELDALVMLVNQLGSVPEFGWPEARHGFLSGAERPGDTTASSGWKKTTILAAVFLVLCLLMLIRMGQAVRQVQSALGDPGGQLVAVEQSSRPPATPSEESTPPQRSTRVVPFVVLTVALTAGTAALLLRVTRRKPADAPDQT